MRPGSLGRAVQWLLASVSLVCCAFLVVVYALRPAWAVAVTVFPSWAWAPVGIVPAVLSHARGHWRSTCLLLLAWVAFILIFAEEPRALLSIHRRWPDPAWLAARGEGNGLRIITLNCYGGKPEAAAEALSYEPDLLLLQETPGRRELEEVLRTRPGHGLCYGIDTAVAARGTVQELSASSEDPIYLVRARVVVGGRAVNVISVHLTLPYCSLDLWRPRAWQRARSIHESRREQMQTLAAYVERLGTDVPVVVGGDFNTPAGDSLFRIMPVRLRDTFREAGIRFPNTIVNDIPISRIDYVFVDEHLRVHSVVARQTTHSDHRMVICDVSWP